MHFDVIVEASSPHEKAIEYGKEFLNTVGQGAQKMTQEECQFCHIRTQPWWRAGLKKKDTLFKKWKFRKQN